MLRIAYGKLGRIVIFDQSKWKMSGEAEATNLLYRLAERNPAIEWHVIGKSSGTPDPRYPNIVRYWDESTPKSAWGVVPGGGGHMCNHCKTPVTEYTYRLLCCGRSKSATEYEEHLAQLAPSLDGAVFHLGQHGTSHNFIPKVGRTWDDQARDARVRPYVWAFNYGGYAVRALNALMDAHDGETGRMAWLCPDPRNYMNGRDVKWPTGLDEFEPVLAQYGCVLNGVHERWRDGRRPDHLGMDARIDGGTWRVQHHYRQSGLDMQMLPDDWESWPGEAFADRHPIGVVSTAAYLPRRDFRRSAMIADWVLSSFPSAPIYGKWDDRSLADLPAGANIAANTPHDFAQLLGSLRTTVVLPPTPAGADGMKWCTAKPWQAFAARAVAFMLPPVDAQGWVIPATRQVPGTRQVGVGLWSARDDWADEDLHLASWLRPQSPAELQVRAHAASTSPATWEWLVTAQRRLLARRWELREIESSIEERLKLR
jgi:hypothetical protein